MPSLNRTPRLASALAALLLLALLAMGASPALAEGDLEDLQNRAIAASAAYQQAQDRVDALNDQIAENQSRIDQIEATLPQQRERASLAMRSQYRLQENGPGLVSLILSADTLGELIEQVTYLDTIANYQTDAIAELKNSEAELDRTKATLEAQKTDAERQAASARQAYDEAESASQAARRKAVEHAASAQAAYEAQRAAGTVSDPSTTAVNDSLSSDGGTGTSPMRPANAGTGSSSGSSQGSNAETPYTYVLASMYGVGDGLMYGVTASGDIVTPTSMAVAMKTMPLGTIIEITYRGRTVRAEVNDRGPYAGNRQIDLQPAVAAALGFDGVGTVGYRVVG
ncbi:RlpA-like double-psi beta-barrel domain-containing protein [Olsenella sp. HMSC062G07]|uniref:RlpA-like double-psi beta-barrel domain-containing protein n=1 Tax=Olsenella sp. HMSC062G07 TaxID=1739330 RepID=UPI0008A4E940|nr:RlpA-like double-psi beta-barrel domain-containing protein [Olsenella sp. HMSC062G07]OFK24105.1 hypothetical protein HMPREF2826_08225 [Olsenella sp. HMSC062G07]